MENSIVKVIHVFGSLNVGGAESRIMDVFRKIDRKRVMFHFISLDESTNQFFENEINSLSGVVDKVPSPRIIGVINHINALVKIFKKNNKNGKLIVHAHTLHHCGIVMLAAKIAKVKIRISHARSTGSKNKGLKTNIMIRVGKILISNLATEMLAITEETARFLYAKRHVENNRVKIIPNAIELENYKEIPRDELSKLKSEFKIFEDDVVIGHVGRFEEMKNHRFLIKLFEKYHKVNPKSTLVLIGEGSLKLEMEQLVKDLKLYDKVKFLGLRDDVYLWMNIFDLVIMPSLFEGLPGLASESQAAGTPCILSDTITQKSDLGLGLVTYKSITDSFESWLKAIDRSLNVKPPSFVKIEKKFDENNLSLSKEIELLYKIYNICL